ncbi:MAG: class I SAM-dependent methyltransferase [Gemmatimonadetes bacterium]|nr:class I SAM-dependent methyltransferase [Gemmatimonadota bacterium]
MKSYDLSQSRMLRRTAGWAAGSGIALGLGIAQLVRVGNPAAGTATIVVSLLVGVLALGVPIMAVGLVLYQLREAGGQLRELINIRPLLGDMPVPFGGWAMEPRLGALIVETMQRRRPRLMVECGSGSSTILTAEVLRRFGSGRLISLEHEPVFAEETRERLRERGLDAWAEVITAPLVDRDVDGTTHVWYDVDINEHFDEIDLLVVDGPPRRASPLARYPAVPILRTHFADGCIILLDDGNRPDERRTARIWTKLLGARARHYTSGKGAWILELTRGGGGVAAGAE